MSSEATPLEAVGVVGPAIARVLDLVSAVDVEITGPATSFRLPGDRVRMEYPTRGAGPLVIELEPGEWVDLGGEAGFP